MSKCTKKVAKKMWTKLSRAQDSFNTVKNWMVLCGQDFFNHAPRFRKAFAKIEKLAREMRE